jgi:hypothetical protein
MGSQKSTTTSSGYQKATPTAMENQLNQMQMGMLQDGGVMGGQYGDIINKLLLGQSLGGNYSNLYGIDSGMASQMAQESVRGIPAYMQQHGMLDSGTAASVYGRTYGDTLRNVAQFNTQQQGNVLQMGLGGMLQGQGLNMGLQEMLGNRLAGLRTIRTSGSETTKSPMFTGSNIMQGIGTGIGVFSALK